MIESHERLLQIGQALKEPARGRGLVVVSGGGPTGFTAAIALKRQGHRVVLAEKRPRLTRLNVLTLQAEAASILDRLGVLERLKESEAVILAEHRVHQVDPFGIETVWTYPCEELPPQRGPLLPSESFNAEPLMTTPITNLQRVLNEVAIEQGVLVAKGARLTVVSPAKIGENHRVKISRRDESLLLSPELIVLAEGVRSPNAKALGIQAAESLARESWYFGNIPHSGDRNFIGIIGDLRSKSPSGHPVPDISNCIANSKTKMVNVAIRFRPGTRVSQENISYRLNRAADRIDPLTDLPRTVHAQASFEDRIRWQTREPVDITNRKCRDFWVGNNVLIAGDTCGSGSPLAGLGATLGTSAYVQAIEAVGTHLLAHGAAAGALQRYGEEVSAWVDAWHRHAAENEALLLGRENPTSKDGRLSLEKQLQPNLQPSDRT